MISREQIIEKIKNNDFIVYQVREPNFLLPNASHITFNEVIALNLLDTLSAMLAASGGTQYFNTEEEAIAFCEYNLKRTDTLHIPTFQELKEQKYFEFISKEGHKCAVYYTDNEIWFKDYGTSSKGKIFEATEKEYQKIRALCKKLFIGEE